MPSVRELRDRMKKSLSSYIGATVDVGKQLGLEKYFAGRFVDRALENEKVRKTFKDYVVSKISLRSGLDYDTVNTYVKSWAESASDEHPRSLAMQVAAASMFGFELNEFVTNAVDTVRDEKGIGDVEWDSMVNEASAILEAVYQETQDLLSELGIDEIVLARGIKLDDSEKLSKFLPRDVAVKLDSVMRDFSRQVEVAWSEYFERVEHGISALEDIEEDDEDFDSDEYESRMEQLVRELDDKISGAWRAAQSKLLDIADILSEEFEGDYEMNPLSSWSASHSVAGSGDFSTSNHNIRAVLFSVIPRERIVSTPLTGFGCLNECEFIVAGGPIRAKLSVAPVVPKYDEDWGGFANAVSSWKPGGAGLKLAVYYVDIGADGKLDKEPVLVIDEDGSVEGQGPIVSEVAAVLAKSGLPGVVSSLENGYFICEPLDSHSMLLLQTGGEKVYLKPGEQPPEGVQVHTGPRGGRFYYSRPRAPDEPEEQQARAARRLPSVWDIEFRQKGLDKQYLAIASDLIKRFVGEDVLEGRDIRMMLYDSEIRGMFKDYVVAKLSQKTGLDYKTVNEFVKTWAMSSSDAMPRSVAMQIAASELFGFEPTEFVMESARIVSQQVADWDGMVETAKTILRAIYDETQKLLEENGIEWVPLSRGFKIRGKPDYLLPEELADRLHSTLGDYPGSGSLGKLHWEIILKRDELKEKYGDLDQNWYEFVGEFGPIVDRANEILAQEFEKLIEGLRDIAGELSMGIEGDYEMNPLSSWTSDSFVSSDSLFSYGDYLQAEFWTIVPREAVVSTPFTGFGCLNENEFVVAGNLVRARLRLCPLRKKIRFYKDSSGEETDVVIHIGSEPVDLAKMYQSSLGGQ